MKNHHHLARIVKSILACTALSLVLRAGNVSAQILTLISPTVNDGGFESVTSGTGVAFTPVASATSDVPYWGLAGGIITDSGAQNQGAGGNTVQAGVSGSYYKFTDSPAFNLASTYRINAGDQFTLTWYANSSGATLSSQTVTLFSQSAANSGASYSYNPVRTLTTTAGNTAYALNQLAFTQYTLTYTAVAADVGNSIGLTFGNGGSTTAPADTANTFVTADTFTLSVVPIPEPSTYAAVCAGLGALALMRRRQPRAV